MARTMEWMGLALWALALAMALPIAGGGALAAPALGAQALGVVAGFTLAVLYVALSAGRWMALASGGLALAATAALMAGVAVLASDAPRSATAGEDAEELAAGLSGVQLPLLLTIAFCMLLAGGGVTTIG